MYAIEQLILEFLLRFFSADEINLLFNNPQVVAILLAALVSVATSVLGVFLLLRKMTMTADAISHTILLGIVVAFLIIAAGGGVPELNSPWLLIGAASAGVLTVVLTEAMERSGLVKGDAALGLIFPLLFAVAVILVSRFTSNVHLDQDSVLVGEIGVAWANTNSHCLDNCEDVMIAVGHPKATTGRRCVNCESEKLNPRDPRARFEEVCSNCGTYTAAEAWRLRLVDQPPNLVFFPKALTVIGLVALINILFVVLFYKELKLGTFDSGLASALRFHPAVMNYALMLLVSLTAVAAFDAVGAVLVVAFFVIPVATAYLLTDRLFLMFLIAPVLGILASFFGYELARGYFFGVEVSRILAWLSNFINLGGYVSWNVSISASIVIIQFCFFGLVWAFSPNYGLVSRMIRRWLQRREFYQQTMLGHISNHQNMPDAAVELNPATVHQHLNWPRLRTQRVLRQLRYFVTEQDGLLALTGPGMRRHHIFRLELGLDKAGALEQAPQQDHKD
jgi:manganese/zinc/iron transport system permease protein